MRYVVVAMVCLCGALAAFSVYSTHPAAHSVSLGQPVYAGVCGLGVFAFRGWILKTACLLVAIVFFPLWMFLPDIIGSSPPELRVYSKNIWWANTELDALARDIIEEAPDVVLLQEVSDRNESLLTRLRAQFPHQHLCRYSSWSNLAVLSAWPFDGAGWCSGERALALVTIRRGQQPVTMGSVHIPWPWPYNAAEGLQAAVDLLDTHATERASGRAPGPIVLGGDLNAFAWSQGARRLRRASDTVPALPLSPTLSLRGLPLPIDMVMAPDGGEARYRPFLGSDHRGVVADVILLRL